MNKGSIFGQDTVFFRGMNQVGNVIIVTLLWLAGCIPIVTIGTSSTAMYYTMVKSVRHGEGYVTREFLAAYKRNLKNGILLTLIFLLLAGVLAVDRIYMDRLGTQTAAAMSLGYTLLILVCAGLFLYIWPVLSRFTMGKWACFRLSLLMVFRHLPFTILFLVIWIAGICLVVLIPVPMIFVIPGACCYGESFLMEKLLRKYMARPETEEEEEKWYYKG